jgi:hypothetical protein
VPWADVCHEDVTWLRKRFVEVYSAVVQEAETTLQIGGPTPEWFALERPLAPELTALLAQIGERIA